MPDQDDLELEYYAVFAAEQTEDQADDHGVKFYDKNN